MPSFTTKAFLGDRRRTADNKERVSQTRSSTPHQEPGTRLTWVQNFSQRLREGVSRVRGHRNTANKGNGKYVLGANAKEQHTRVLRLVHHALGSEDYSVVLGLPDDEAQIAADLLQTVSASLN